MRRVLLIALSALSTGLTALELHRVLAVKGHTSLEWAWLALFTVLVLWSSLAFWSAAAGFFALVLKHSRPRGLVWPSGEKPLASRTAIVLPVHNEDPAEVFAHVEAVLRALDATGQGEAFHFFILSDTTDPDGWVAEELEWAHSCQRLGGRGRLFYRRRTHNEHKKSGNLADFCRKWALGYDFLVVLDADSVLAGETLVTMARLMEANPDAGIIQAPPRLVGRQTLFARLMQFGAGVYGPVNAAGIAYWSGGDANYWGHNAIIRSQAFLRHCGLPVLPGKPPFGGEILSHDFVEAALMRRGGYRVWLVPELEGSYEQPPPTMVDFVKRDQRWCQGNLQHLRLLFSAGLHPMSRLHFGLGAMSYLASPLWLLFLVLGLAVMLQDPTIEPAYFGPEKGLGPLWAALDFDAARRLTGFSLALLLGPKLFGLLWSLTGGARTGGIRSRLSIAATFVPELLLGALLAPIHMLEQTRFVQAALAGRSVTWGSQQRKDRSTSWSEAWEFHHLHTWVGALLVLATYAWEPAYLPWVLPASVGLLLAAPLSVLTSSPALGRLLARVGLFTIDEERAPPPVLADAWQAREALRAASTPVSGLAAVLGDPTVRRLHLGLLEPGAARPAPSVIERVRQGARVALTRAEALAVLSDGLLLRELSSNVDRPPAV